MNIVELSILLVEPSPTQLKVILRHLAEEGVRFVQGAQSGKEALEAMAQYSPDLVASAMYLPDMTATDLVAAMRERPGLEAVPFMLVSSETDFGRLEPLRQAGIVAILPKPFDHEHLRRALRSTVAYIDPGAADLAELGLDDLRVLVVDDSGLSRKHIGRILSSLGIDRISYAANGLEAAAVFERHFYDLVVTDLNMPGMDGQGLVEFIRQRMGNTSIPILMVTSEQDMARLSHVEQAGVSAICDKPFEVQTIRDVLYRILKA
jgi:two-component system chemotaxis response regulator CheY